MKNIGSKDVTPKPENTSRMEAVMMRVLVGYLFILFAVILFITIFITDADALLILFLAWILYKVGDRWSDGKPVVTIEYASGEVKEW